MNNDATVKLDRLWINKAGDRQELRFDWSNDRRHAVEIKPPFGAEQIAKALSDASRLIGGDPSLIATRNEGEL